MVRFEIMRRFGYYVTESSEHSAEHMPFWIKARYPELIEEFNIPLDEYPRRCIEQIKEWEKQGIELVENKALDHFRTLEYGAYIMEAVETDIPYRIHGNVINTGLIPNLPANACVEVPCLVDRNGIRGCHVGDLPEQCAALNRTNINVHLLGIEAAMTRIVNKLVHRLINNFHAVARDYGPREAQHMIESIIKFEDRSNCPAKSLSQEK